MERHDNTAFQIYAHGEMFFSINVWDQARSSFTSLVLDLHLESSANHAEV